MQYSEIVDEVKKEDNIIMVHMDLLVGLSGKRLLLILLKHIRKQMEL